MCTAPPQLCFPRQRTQDYSEFVHRRLRFRSFALMLVLVCACRPQAREFSLHGQVTALARKRAEVTVKHDDIPGFMPAMTMAYRVKDPAALNGIAPGDLVSARLIVPEGELPYLSQITRTGHADLTSPAPAARVMDVLNPGDVVPDDPFQDQNGVTRRLSDWRGKAVAVTFVYTRCPMPDFCPLMDRKFAAVQRAAQSDGATASAVHLVSITIDPEHDTPGVLKDHAAALGADPRMWSFLTAAVSATIDFASRFGISVIDEGPAPTLTHNLRTAVIDHRGRLVKIYSGSDWTPEALITDLRDAGRR